jgi:hypothetical protein
MGSPLGAASAAPMQQQGRLSVPGMSLAPQQQQQGMVLRTVVGFLSQKQQQQGVSLPPGIGHAQQQQHGMMLRTGMGPPMQQVPPPGAGLAPWQPQQQPLPPPGMAPALWQQQLEHPPGVHLMSNPLAGTPPDAPAQYASAAHNAGLGQGGGAAAAALHLSAQVPAPTPAAPLDAPPSPMYSIGHLPLELLEDELAALPSLDVDPASIEGAPELQRTADSAQVCPANAVHAAHPAAYNGRVYDMYFR